MTPLSYFRARNSMKAAFTLSLFTSPLLDNVLDQLQGSDSVGVTTSAASGHTLSRGRKDGGVERKGRGKSECIMTQRQEKNSRIHADMYGYLEKSYDHESWVADLSSESKSPGFVLAKSLFRSWKNHAHTSSLASLAAGSTAKCHIDALQLANHQPLPQEHRHRRANHWIWKSPDLRKQGMPLSQRNNIDSPSIMDYDDYAPVHVDMCLPKNQ